MIKNIFEAVEFDSIRVGDVVHVHWGVDDASELYLNQEITEVSRSGVKSDAYDFWYSLCKFYLVAKAKKSLPTKLGSVIEHSDGWRFLRVGVDSWVGVGVVEGQGDLFWTDAEVEDYDEGDVEWKEVA